MWLPIHKTIQRNNVQMNAKPHSISPFCCGLVPAGLGLFAPHAGIHSVLPGAPQCHQHSRGLPVCWCPRRAQVQCSMHSVVLVIRIRKCFASMQGSQYPSTSGAIRAAASFFTWFGSTVLKEDLGVCPAIRLSPTSQTASAC